MNKKIKIIHLTEDLKVGGLECVMAMIASGLDKEKYHQEIWAIARGGDMVAEMQSQGIIVKVLNIPSYYNPFNILKLAKAFKEFSPDIIHSHTYFSNTISRLSGGFAKVPMMIVHVHNVYSQYSPRNLWIEKNLSHWTKKIICCSEAVRQFVLLKENIDAEKTIMIHNGINIKKFQVVTDSDQLRQELNISLEDKVLITVASLTSKKGHCYFLEALKGVISIQKNIKCLLIGNGPLRQELEEYTRQNNLESYVKFLGIRKDTPALLQMSDIFVLPSLTEGLPLVAAEAMASGLPVVATQVGGTAEVVENGKTGLLVPSKDSESLMKALVAFLNNPSDVKQMGEEGKKYAEKYFSVDIMLKKIEKLYDRIIA